MWLSFIDRAISDDTAFLFLRIQRLIEARRSDIGRAPGRVAKAIPAKPLIPATRGREGRAPMTAFSTQRFVTRFLATASLLALSIGFAPSSAQAQSLGVSSLYGLSAVFVQVEDLPDGAKLRGLTKATIQADVEQRLRRAGMRVVTEEESVRLPGSPYVYVQVSLADHARAASIDVELNQGALLVRNGAVVPSIITWRRGALLTKPTTQSVRDAVNDRVDAFLTAWLSVNPPRSS